MIEEFIAQEYKEGRIDRMQFTSDSKLIKLHGHCYQKALASTSPVIQMLSIPVNFNVEEIPSGCCGMSGAFGFEKEHYELSMKVGELILLPEIRKSSPETLITASGTSCRHQIKDGSGRDSLHPVEILREAMVV